MISSGTASGLAVTVSRVIEIALPDFLTSGLPPITRLIAAIGSQSSLFIFIAASYSSLPETLPPSANFLPLSALTKSLPTFCGIPNRLAAFLS